MIRKSGSRFSLKDHARTGRSQTAHTGAAGGAADNNPTKPSGFAGGVQAGYNWQQNGPWVFGIEGDIQASGAEQTFAPWKFSNPWFGTLRGRAGYALNNVLFYGTGGLA